MSQENLQLDRLENIISLGQEIKKTREHLGSLIDRWNATYPEFPISGTQAVAKHPAFELPEYTPLGSIDERIVSYLDEHSGQAFNVNMLYDKLQVGPASLGTQLSKLYNAKRIARVGRGLYQSLKEKEATEVTS